MEKLPNRAAASSPLGVPASQALGGLDAAEQHDGGAAADGAALRPSSRNGAGTGWPTNAIGGADIVQDFDDGPVRRHGAAGREGDRQHGDGEHQPQNAEAGATAVLAMVRIRAIQRAVVVETGGGDLAASALRSAA